MQCDESVLTECKAENPSVSSEIHIKDLVTFKVSRLMQEINLKEVNLDDAVYNVNATRWGRVSGLFSGVPASILAPQYPTAKISDFTSRNGASGLR